MAGLGRLRRALSFLRPASSLTAWLAVLAGALVLSPIVSRGVALAADTPGPDPALDARIEAARALRLADTAEWQRLLHWHDGTFSRRASRVDEPTFFLAPDGKHDAAAELEATLHAFFAPAEALAVEAPRRPNDAPVAQHPQCAFVARRAFLDARLGLRDAGMGWAACPDYAAFRDALGARGVTLVFPEAFPNNPASMFGHTFLRLERRDPVRGDEPDLVGWAVNFSGDTGEGDPGPLYAMKGLVGLYPGYYTIEPYWERVRAYGDLERRDLWEYPLGLDAEALDRLLAHLWELRGARFDYFYFDENCSLRLLELLEVALPESDLTTGLAPWVIPVDAVRRVRAATGDAGHVVWRPAPVTELRHTAGLLSAAERDLVRDLAQGTREPDDPAVAALATDEQARVIGAAYELLRTRFLGHETSRGESAGRARALLLARSRLPEASASPGAVAAPTPPRVRPDEGHRSARIAFAGGFGADGPFLEASLRPAFHDLLDPQGGYTRGAEVRMLDGTLRWLPEKQRVRLEELTLLGIASEPAFDSWLRLPAWRLDLGLHRRLLRDEHDLDERLVASASAGVGLSTELVRHTTAYGFLEAWGDAGNALHRDFALGPGARVGLRLADPADRVASHLFALARAPLLGDSTFAWSVGLSQRLALDRSRALLLDVSRDGADGRGVWRAKLGVAAFF